MPLPYMMGCRFVDSHICLLTLNSFAKIILIIHARQLNIQKIILILFFRLQVDYRHWKLIKHGKCSNFFSYYKYFFSIIDPINLYGVLNLNKIAELGQNGPNQANEWIDV